MKFNKIVLDSIERCYCASHLYVDGELKIILASEVVDGPCCAYSGTNFEKKEVLWEKPGGTMSLVPIPGTNGEFLAIQCSYPGFNAKDSKIVWGKYTSNGWVIKDFISIPYLHRFDILESEGRTFFLGATSCNSRKDRNDWSDPGKVWVCEMPKTCDEQVSLRPIKDFLLKNHGYWRGSWGGVQAGFVTCDSGIYVFSPPGKNRDWDITQILAGQISDVTCIDLDGDGVDELVTISPFHGNELFIRKKVSETRYETVYRYPNPIDLAHALWAGHFQGVPTVIFGIRMADGELGYIRYDHEKKDYKATIIEKDVGTANVSVANHNGNDIIVAANHTKNEAAVYIPQS